MPGRVAPALALVIAAAFVAAGCSQKLDTGEIESGIQRDLAERTGTRIASVDCPDDVEADQGDRFRCTARAAAGERVPVEVIQEDGDGRVRWRLVNR
jgi:Domain of unknown function (DUF4333)